MLKIPASLTQEILFALIAKGLVVEIAKGVRKDASFQPGRTIEKITVKEVLDAYEAGEDPELPQTQHDENAKKLAAYLKMISDTAEKSPGNVKLEDI